MPPKKRARKDASSSDEGSTYESEAPYPVETVDSDALDEATPPPSSQTVMKKTNRNRKSPVKGKEIQAVASAKKANRPKQKNTKQNVKSSTKGTSSSKKRKREDSDEELGCEDDDSGFELVGKFVQAPTAGRVPPGQISQNTFDFLNELKDPKHNDREWFKLHEPVYRQAEKEWSDFIEAFTDILTDVDDEIPHLPPKDVIHRIYRDVRFSNDKTPYKPPFHELGEKEHLPITIFKPGGGSIFASGVWCPGKNELDTIRARIRQDSSQLRAVISEPTFESLFGPAKWSKDKRQNIFGGEDQLKVAPKGVAKDHPDIDLLKCRSFAVVHRFKDEQVLDPEFKEILRVVAEGAKPFVHLLNHMMTMHDEDEEGDAES